ncbi:hypothetical protein [Microbacterium sp.]|uniref:hypothetical protein n=1 Tax=Microbacterium sp. TaxID=51671 RepID=UPI002811247F|nr:hypothetical protein [Microbacterium sp.]
MTRYRLAPDVGVIDDGVRVFAAALPEGPIVVLAGIGAEVWRAVLDADLPTATARLVTEGAGPQEEAASDAALYTAALVDAGLLVAEHGEDV